MFCTVMKILYCNENLPVLDDPGRVRNQITSAVCQIQRFGFDCNLVVMRKVIMGIPPALGLNLYSLSSSFFFDYGFSASK